MLNVIVLSNLLTLDYDVYGSLYGMSKENIPLDYFFEYA